VARLKAKRKNVRVLQDETQADGLPGKGREIDIAGNILQRESSAVCCSAGRQQ